LQAVLQKLEAVLQSLEADIPFDLILPYLNLAMFKGNWYINMYKHNYTGASGASGASGGETWTKQKMIQARSDPGGA
jgi:hypothetical protein